jgi:hypothetical protein
VFLAIGRYESILLIQNFWFVSNFIMEFSTKHICVVISDNLFSCHLCIKTLSGRSKRSIQKPVENSNSCWVDISCRWHSNSTFLSLERTFWTCCHWTHLNRTAIAKSSTNVIGEKLRYRRDTAWFSRICSIGFNGQADGRAAQVFHSYLRARGCCDGM